MKKSLVPLAAAGAVVALAVVGASAQRPDDHEGMPKAKAVRKAVAVLRPTNKAEGKARGVVHFTKEDRGIRVHGRVAGLTPGKHGFHIHEFGDVSSPDGTAAGGHYNPTDAPHGGPDSRRRHVGDFGNLEANAEGVAEVDFLDEQVSFQGERSILGRGLIVHAKADDLKTQPSGDAGDRVAQGVIGAAGTVMQKAAAKTKEAIAKTKKAAEAKKD